jgi:hypothetical protein
MIEREGKRALLERRARLRRLAVDQEGIGETGTPFNSASFSVSVAPDCWQPHSRRGPGRSRVQQQVERQALAADRARGFDRQHPAADRAGTVSAASGPRDGIVSCWR